MRKKMLVFGVPGLLMLSGLVLASTAQAPERQIPPGDLIPAYHAGPPKGALAPTLSPNEFPLDPITDHAYAAAGQIKPVVYQLPCYCHCDREMGHTSLLSCYQDRHAAECATCKMEAFYAYEQTRKGKSASQIREGIIRGDWQKVNLSKWSTASVSKAPKKR